MTSEYVRLVDLIIGRGHFISVYTGGDEPDVIRSRNRAEVLDAIESVDLSELRVYAETVGGNERYRFQFWAQVIPFGVEPDCTVVDYTDNGYYMPEVV